MMRKLGMVAAIFVALSVLLLAVACGPEKSCRAERFDVDVLVRADGSATITETVTFAFRGAPFSYAFRELPLDRTDGIANIAIAEGGDRYTPGTGPGQFELRTSGDARRVTWHFTPTENAARTFVLTYDVAGLVRQEGAQDVLRWTALPPEHDYGITHAQVIVRLPDNVGPLAGAQVLDGHAQPGILGRQVTFVADEVEPDQALAVAVWFPHGQLRGVPPAWQRLELSQARWAPLWAALAAFVILAAAVACVFVWRRWGREPVAVTQSLLFAPPSDLPVGLAGALLHNGARRPDILATLFDLARRGALAVEETPPAGLSRKPGYALRLLALPAGLRPHEAWTLFVAALQTATGRKHLTKEERTAAAPDRALLDSLAASGAPIPLGGLAAAVERHYGTLQRAYDAELYAQGLFEHRRDGVRRVPIIASVALLLLSAASVAGMIFWWRAFGPWPLLVTFALMLAGLAVLLVGLACARRSAPGEQAAGDWRAFRRHLQALARGRARLDEAALFDSYLPYAVAFGLHARWAKQMAAAGAPAPAWFRTLSQEATADGGAAAFLVMVSAVSSSVHGAGGAGGAAGAAGGGASGAG